LRGGARADTIRAMPLYQAIVLGIVQGLAEFLPVSSTAHLVIVPALLGWEDPGLSFDVALHFGTFVAVAVYFRRELARVIAGGLRTFVRPALRTDPDQRLAWMLVLATIPGGIAGFLFEKRVEEDFRAPALIGAAMAGFALVILWAEARSRRDRPLAAAGYLDALIIGCAQVLALVPGVSRSGSTIAAGLFRGLTRDAAARFSFLLGLTTIGGACALKVKDVVRGRVLLDASFFAGVATSALVGYAAIGLLLGYVRTRSFAVFVVYRLLAGGIVLYLALSGRIH
jgi:undecaprenyl-diphosphatase